MRFLELGNYMKPVKALNFIVIYYNLLKAYNVK